MPACIAVPVYATAPVCTTPAVCNTAPLLCIEFQKEPLPRESARITLTPICVHEASAKLAAENQVDRFNRPFCGAR
eukprot:2270491-Pyramimonas_sp.AAC.1